MFFFFLRAQQEEDYFLSPSMHYFAFVDTEFHLPVFAAQCQELSFQATLDQMTVNNFGILYKFCDLLKIKSLMNMLNSSENSTDL